MRLLAPALIVGTLILGAAVAVAAPRIAAQGPGAASARTTILPGQWEYSYRVGPIPAGSEDHCLKKEDVEQFAKGICTRRYTCDYDTKVVQDGKVSLKGTWTDKKGRVAPVTADGVYSPESFRLNVHMKTINGLALAGVMDAKRVSAECTPE